ncbi:MAG: CPBP family intramembrane metalloprotease [Candidatus Aminicenantes bacterium]|nr:CPBP family intramembrane metalloprotease [Candidatus Aminicenantes bacterium]
MAISVETSSWPGILLVWEAVALTLLQTFFGRKRFLGISRDDLQAARRYFLSVFTLGLALPLAAVLFIAAEPARVLDGIGLRVGNWRLGLILAAVAVPVGWILGKLGSSDPVMRAFYPFSKKAMENGTMFLRYEACYFLFYYTAWEFVFRGVFFFPLEAAAGLLPALAVSTIVSTLFHIGHPDTEILAALGGGFIFGFIAWKTGSFLYLIPIHAALGIATDSHLFRAAAKERAGR